MRGMRDRDERDVERLLGGRGPVGEGDARLATALAGIRGAFPEAPIAAETRTAHIAAIAAAVDQLDPASAPARAPRHGRRRVFGRTGRVAILAATLLLAFSSLALAGLLPAPLQHAVSRAVAALGLNLPGGGSAPAAPSSVAPSTMPSADPSPDVSNASHPRPATPKARPSSTSAAHPAADDGSGDGGDEDAQQDEATPDDQQQGGAGDETDAQQPSNGGSGGDQQDQPRDDTQKQTEHQTQGPGGE